MNIRLFHRFILVAAGVLASSAIVSNASDHDESPLVKVDASMDITDLYVFGSGRGETTVIVDWAGFNDSRTQPDSAAVYNSNALYTLHIDNNQDNVADIEVLWRFGTNAKGEWGVKVENIPGGNPLVTGPVEEVIDGGNGTRIWVGHADDPFFFDAAGYLDTLATGKLMIRNDRDFLAGLNVTAIALEMRNDGMRSGDQPLQFWVTSARK